MGRIYKITNLINSKSYIGFTTKSLQERFSRHKLNSRYSYQNTYLNKAMRKYGVDNFTIELLQENANLDTDEPKWISELNPEYNMTAGGEGGDTSKSPNYIAGIKRHNETLSPKDYATYGHLGKKHSSEAKAKQSLARTKCWENMTPEEYQSRCNSLRGEKNWMTGKTPANAKKVTVGGITYESMTAACKDLNLSKYQLWKQHIKK